MHAQECYLLSLHDNTVHIVYKNVLLRLLAIPIGSPSACCETQLTKHVSKQMPACIKLRLFAQCKTKKSIAIVNSGGHRTFRVLGASRSLGASS